MADLAQPARHRFLVLLVTMAVHTLATLVIVIPAAVAPEIAAALGVDAALIGFQVGFAYLGGAVTSAVAGTLVGRWGALRMSQWALLFAAAGAGLMALPSLAALAAGAVVAGFGYGLTNPPAAHLLARVTTPTNRNFLFSIKQTSVPLGGIAAGFAAPPLALLWGHESPLWITAAIALAVALAMQPLRAPWDTDRDPTVSLRGNPFAALILIWRDPRLRLVAIAAFCFAGIQLSLTTFAVTMLVADLAFGLIEAGIVLAVLQVAGVTGRLWWGWVADRLRDGNAVLLVIATISISAAVLTTQLSPATPHLPVFVLMAAFSLAAVGWNGVFMAEVAHLAPPNMVSSATGGVLVVTYAGVVATPSAFAAAHATIGSYTATFGVFALVPILGMAVVWRLRRRMKSSGAPP